MPISLYIKAFQEIHVRDERLFADFVFCITAYKGANRWKDFANIFELVEGDLNLDDVVDQNDMDALVGFVMGENPEGFYEGLADLNGDNKIDAADVVKMVDLVRASSD